ncbi:hypothetical protein [Pseudomonas mucidolens]|uniref:Uncharacterized protein n=1 Tax=Pseudomonas mucidolens TaxID=46679 RepID=A0A1H2LZE8_9PSED|nr:hypothetical protein [Pseudomonas mucidolens]SDU86105.1 hypothetical protein SAMN05216202_0722 [Pseudomonas mucidolens]SQH34970.1 Uncharacterised protein [Pseudomonas mucidolens]
MKGMLLFALLLLLVCTMSIGINTALPSPDGALFAIAILLSAAFTAVSLCIELVEGQINDMGDLMKIIETGQSLRLSLAAYALGCSLAAAITVLVYRGLSGG